MIHHKSIFMGRLTGPVIIALKHLVYQKVIR